MVNPDQLITPYGQSLDPDAVLQEYPRPQLQRDSYLNLNGYWKFRITDMNQDLAEITPPDVDYEGQILVPFSPESVLSGVSRFLEPDQLLHYQRTVTLPKDFHEGRLIIHFGAVDQWARIFIDGKIAGEHEGGFTPFAIDITDLVHNQSFDLQVLVRDESDTAIHQTGKQRIERGGIWYTPQSGIWQTVWLESVPDHYICDLTLKPLFDEKAVQIDFVCTGRGTIQVEAFFEGTSAGTASLELDASDYLQKSRNGKETPSDVPVTCGQIILPLSEFHPWSPESPHLYDLQINYCEDSVKSYFGMRHFSMQTDLHGRKQFFLNHRPCFQNGVLDQGYYPDGLLTPPSDEAMIHDIDTMKKMGFNLLRKHIKIEPLRWYYHCDRLGMLVWQDMVNGSERKDIILHGALAIAGIHLKDNKYRLFGRKDAAGRNQYEKELDEMLNHLKNVVSINTWVPFNEAWGQFESSRICEHVAQKDSTRLIDHASGWSDQKTGHYHSRHIYFTKIRFRSKAAQNRILALTEFGGYSLPVKDHMFNPDRIFGYKKFDDGQKYEEAVERLYQQEVLPCIRKGLAVLVYTQLSDVEDEINGFITYDRKFTKMDPERMRLINVRLKNAFDTMQSENL
ncbi:MAG: glycoside hydrolase family 2 TIM barrel-domain containing protein [Leptospiraceae bacterium]